MRKPLIVLAMSAFLGISVFGFFAMGHASDHGNCIAKILQGEACKATDIFGVASYHLSAFEKAVRATPASSLSALLLLATLAVVLAVFAVRPQSPNFHATYSNLNVAESPQKISLLRWLSFHENSPNASFAR